MSDKVEQTPGSSDAGKSPQVDPKAFADLQAKQTALEADLVKERADKANLRKVMGRMGNELAVHRTRAAQATRQVYNPAAIDYAVEFGDDAADGADPNAGQDRGQQRGTQADPSDARIANLTYSTEMLRFRSDHPEWATPEKWAKIMEIVDDPVKAAEHVRFGKDASPDYYRSFSSVAKDLELNERRAADAARQAAEQKITDQKAGINQLAMVSGGGAHEAPRTITIDEIKNDPAWTPERIEREFPQLVGGGGGGSVPSSPLPR